MGGSPSRPFPGGGLFIFLPILQQSKVMPSKMSDWALPSPAFCDPLWLFNLISPTAIVSSLTHKRSWEQSLQGQDLTLKVPSLRAPRESRALPVAPVALGQCLGSLPFSPEINQTR